MNNISFLDAIYEAAEKPLTISRRTTNKQLAAIVRWNPRTAIGRQAKAELDRRYKARDDKPKISDSLRKFETALVQRRKLDPELAMHLRTASHKSIKAAINKAAKLADAKNMERNIGRRYKRQLQKHIEVANAEKEQLSQQLETVKAKAEKLRKKKAVTPAASAASIAAQTASTTPAPQTQQPTAAAATVAPKSPEPFKMPHLFDRIKATLKGMKQKSSEENKHIVYTHESGDVFNRQGVWKKHSIHGTAKEAVKKASFIAKTEGKLTRVITPSYPNLRFHPHTGEMHGDDGTRYEFKPGGEPQ